MCVGAVAIRTRSAMKGALRPGKSRLAPFQHGGKTCAHATQEVVAEKLRCLAPKGSFVQAWICMRASTERLGHGKASSAYLEKAHCVLSRRTMPPLGEPAICTHVEARWEDFEGLELALRPRPLNDVTRKEGVEND